MESNRLAATPAPELIAERYCVEKQLGRGGMATVYQVRDRTDGRMVALKRLQLRGAPNNHVERLFELEYYTLSQLAHPRIIEVYDYHADSQGAFYTMELLTGGDLREQTPIAWRELCRLLCDIGSALALLHSRRFVHRDLTPMNVRCTLDGRAKLFDFGSMAQFGRAKHVVGTPPFVAPEALNGEALDAQTDLFSLGATAYHALTGSHAYPARNLAGLADCWRVLPRLPSQLVPGIPSALDDLIMALLSLVPRARPPSAAEVIERLSAIGGFEAQETLVVGEAYLTKPNLVGREDALASFGRGLKRLSNGVGTAVLVHGEPGTGRSRLLDACALAATLSGALVLRTDARAAGDRRWGAAAGLLKQLSQQLPELSATLLAKHTVQLAQVLSEPGPDAPPETPRVLGSVSSPPSSEAQHAGRAEIQLALQEILIALTHQRALALVIDDLDRVDEPSAALLALLAHQTRQQRLLVLASIVSAEKLPESSPLQLMASVSEAWRVRNLDRVYTIRLVVSLFGDIPNVRLLAERIFGATGGNPARVMLTAQRLVHLGACRYAAGTWSLPDTWDDGALRGASRERIDPSLSRRSLELAQALALSGLASVSLDECRELGGHSDLKLLREDVLELAAAGIVTLDNDEVGLSRSSWEPLLLAELTPTLRRVLHLRVVDLLKLRPAMRFRTIEHVFLAGHGELALDMLLAEIKKNRPLRIEDSVRTFEYLQSLPKNWPETYHALIAECRSLGRPLRERLDLELELVAYATLGAQSERSCVLDLAAQLRHDSGLDLIEELRGRVPVDELLPKALTAAQQRYEATPEIERGLPLLEAITALGQLVIQVIGMAGRAFDLSLLEAMPSLAPIAALSPALAVVQKNLNASMDLLSGRGQRSHQPYLEIAQRLEEPDGAGLTRTHRTHMRSAVLWAAGSIEAELGQPRALARADAIESNPLFAVGALQLRALCALAQGDMVTAERYRTQTELLLIQNSPPQLFRGSQVARLLSAYAANGDLLSVKHCLVDLEAMARELATWQPNLHHGRGVYQSLRGDHAQAQAELERSLALMDAGRHASWPACAGALIRALIHQGKFEEAVNRGQLLLAALEAAQLGLASSVWVPLALAESHVLRTDDALQHIHKAIALLSADGGCGVMLGDAYEVRARIALRMADVAAFEEYAAACDVQYRLGNSPTLLARYEKLLRSATELGLFTGVGQPTTTTRVVALEELHAMVTSELGSAHGPAERAERALRLLGGTSHSAAGFLYLLEASGPTLVAQLGAAVAWPEMDAQVESFLKQALAADDITQSLAAATSVADSLWGANEGMRFAPLLLSHTDDRVQCVVGLALVAVIRDSSLRAPTQLLQVLSRALRAAGDSVTLWNGIRVN